MKAARPPAPEKRGTIDWAKEVTTSRVGKRGLSWGAAMPEAKRGRGEVLGAPEVRGGGWGTYSRDGRLHKGKEETVHSSRAGSRWIDLSSRGENCSQFHTSRRKRLGGVEMRARGGESHQGHFP